MHIGQDDEVIEQALVLAREEGWDPGMTDAAAFAEVDPAGWFSARTDDGQIVTTLSALKYTDEIGFMGLFITRPEFRGQGIGEQVWRAGREYLADCGSVGLDGVLEREEFYASEGFVRSHVTTRYSGTAGELENYLDEPDSGLRQDCTLVTTSEVRADQLSEFELRHNLFPAPRAKFLSAWLAEPDSTSLAVVADSGEVLGWGMVRLSANGWRLGPLFALDSHVALILLGNLTAAIPQADTLSIDVPEPNEVATGLLQSAGFEPTFSCIRMYAGQVPRLDLAKIYANTTFELG